MYCFGLEWENKLRMWCQSVLCAVAYFKISHDLPDRLWAKVEVDLFHFNQACVDYFLKFPKTAKLTQSTSQHVIMALKSIFARHGIPNEVATDNGPQFASAQFRNLRPRFIQLQVPDILNQMVKVKELYRPSRTCSRKSWRSLHRSSWGQECATWRSEVISCTADWKPDFQQRVICYNLHKGVRKSLKDRQLKQKLYYDRGARDLPALKEGEKVRLRAENRRQPAVVVEKHEKHIWFFKLRMEKITEEIINTCSRQKSHISRTHSGFIWSSDKWLCFRCGTCTASVATNNTWVVVFNNWSYCRRDCKSDAFWQSG